MRAVSAKRERELVIYRRFVAKLAEDDPTCHVGPRISLVDRTWRGCTRWMDGLHHLQKRSANRSRLLDPTNVLRSCSPCNGWVEDHPELAIEAGLVTRPGDPDWQEPG